MEKMEERSDDESCDYNRFSFCIKSLRSCFPDLTSPPIFLFFVLFLPSFLPLVHHPDLESSFLLLTQFNCKLKSSPGQ